MKKIYALLLMAATIILSASAQPFEKGNTLLGGSIGYSLNRFTNNYNSSTIPNTDSKYYSFYLAPSIGFFTRPNRLSGFLLQFSYGQNVPSGNDEKQKSHTYGAGFYKQYWNSLGKNFYFNIQGRVGASYNKNQLSYFTQTSEDKTGTAYFTIDPGFAYRIKKRLVLDAYYSNFLHTSFNYSDRRVNSVLRSRNYSVGASTGLQSFSLSGVVLGFRYLL